MPAQFQSVASQIQRTSDRLIRIQHFSASVQVKTPRIFISMGTPYRAEYIAFRDELVSMLRDRLDVDPRIIGVNEYPPGSPVHKIRDVMTGCDGVLIVAYERKCVTTGFERRGGTEERMLAGEKYTTPWNHVEPAIAFSLHLPIYVISENGLTEEALIESKVDWFVQRIDFTAAVLSSSQVVDSLRSWITERVGPQSRKSKAILAAAAKLRLSEMTGEEWVAILAMLGTAFGAGVAAAKLLPTAFH
jgi:hypothetical protein